MDLITVGPEPKGRGQFRFQKGRFAFLVRSLTVAARKNGTSRQSGSATRFQESARTLLETALVVRTKPAIGRCSRIELALDNHQQGTPADPLPKQPYPEKCGRSSSTSVVAFVQSKRPTAAARRDSPARALSDHERHHGRTAPRCKSNPILSLRQSEVRLGDNGRGLEAVHRQVVC